MSRRMGYRDSLVWIVLNDDCTWLDDPNPHISATLALVADQFGKDNETVIRNLRRMRERVRQTAPSLHDS